MFFVCVRNPPLIKGLRVCDPERPTMDDGVAFWEHFPFLFFFVVRLCFVVGLWGMYDDDGTTVL